MTRPRVLLAAATVTAAVVLSAGPSVAAGGPAYGEHVSHCARTVGFSSTHNPGMHQGARGWDGMTC